MDEIEEITNVTVILRITDDSQSVSIHIFVRGIQRKTLACLLPSGLPDHTVSSPITSKKPAQFYKIQPKSYPYKLM